MRRHHPTFRTMAVTGLAICLLFGITTAEARRGRGSDDILSDHQHRGRGDDDRPDVRVDAASFFAACPEIEVKRETFVEGRASFVGDCTITVASGRNLHLVDVDLTGMGDLLIKGVGDVDVSIGDENCPDGQICAGSRLDVEALNVNLTGRDSRARVFFSEITAEAIDLLAVGTDAEVRVHESTLDAAAYILLSAVGTDARTRVDVVNERVDRNALAAHSVLIVSEGGNSETRVENTDFAAQRVTIEAAGEARAERNNFGGASVVIAGDDDCRSRDNVPAITCE